MKTRLTLVAILTLLALTMGLTTASAHDPVFGVDPASVVDTVAPGNFIVVNKTVHTLEIPPKPDIYFLADTTGSMDTVITAVQADAATVLGTVAGMTTDERFGAGDYKDFPFDAYAFNNAAPIPVADDSGLAALAAMAAWAAGGGSDGPEGQFYALHQIAAHGAASFRVGSTPIVVWFGDFPAHDPVCTAISGDVHNITEASLTPELVAAGIKVVAISTTTGVPAGLDDDPTAFAGDYLAACGFEGGSAGQATRITAATGGTLLSAVTPSEIADAIVTGLVNLPVTVAPQVGACDADLSLSFDVPSRNVTSGDDAAFVETIDVVAGAPQGGTLNCTIEWLVDGVLPDERFVEQITIHVPGISLDPATSTNEAGTDHTVTATVSAGGAPLGGLLTSFEVTAGPNVGEVSGPGECDANADCTTDGAGQVSWTYTGAIALGSDTIEACFTFEGVELCDSATKTWVDTTPPVPACTPTTNPSGNNVPPAGNNPKSGQNPDGFYELTASDIVDPNPQIFVADTGSSFVAGPYPSGTKIKLVQAPGADPNVKPGTGEIDWKITLKGDALVYAVDASGNQSDPVACLVPPPPK